MSKIRIIFLGTPDFAVEPLKALANDDHFEIVKVFTQPDRPAGRNMKIQSSAVKQAAIDLGLNVESPATINDPSVLESIKELHAEAAVVIAFGQILKQPFLDLFAFGAVNVHASLLPRWRGAAPIQRALEAGDNESGVALQKIVLKLDAGPIIGIRKFAITNEMNAGNLYESLKPLACDLLKIDFMDYIRGNLGTIPQDESLVTIAKKIEKEEGKIRWADSASTIFNKMRAFSNWPGVWTTRIGSNLKIIKAIPVQGKTKSPGYVIEVDKKYFVVSCSEGALKVLDVQPESKSKMSAEQYLLGYPMKENEVLG